MKRRTRVLRAISARHDDALEARRAARLDAEVQNQPALQAEVDALDAIDEALAVWDAPEPGAALASRVMAALPDLEPARASIWSRAWQPTMATATAFVALLVGGLVGGRLQAPPQQVSMAEVHELAFDPLASTSVAGQFVELMLREEQ